MSINFDNAMHTMAHLNKNSATTAGKKRILAVDDQARNTRLVKLYLEQTNRYVVREENNARLALSAAEEFLPHLILLDVMMPGMDGGELAACFKASPKLKAVPIVFLTAVVTKQEVRGRQRTARRQFIPGQTGGSGGNGRLPETPSRRLESDSPASTMETTAILDSNTAAVEIVTEVRREEALLKAGALQNAIFNSANFSSIATDAKGVIQIFNVGAERMLGYSGRRCCQ